MAAIEPGEKFIVGYGNGHEVEVVALSLRQKRTVTKDLKQVQELKTDAGSLDQLYEICDRMLRECLGDVAEDLIDRIDETMAMEIVGKTLGCAALTEEERKK